jgi:superoxide dismutase, Cu-Zn family
MKKTIGSALLVIGLAVRGWAATGTAEMKGTGDNLPMGTVHFEDTAAGLMIQAQLANVPPGVHAFHIHEFGRCAEMGKAAGSHYNPASAPHGQVLKDGIQHAHAGDLGNITADKSGSAALQAILPGVTLAESKYTVGGRAVILHEKADDFSQPAGNAGGRIACGPIVVAGPVAANPAPAK